MIFDGINVNKLQMNPFKEFHSNQQNMYNLTKSCFN